MVKYSRDQSTQAPRRLHLVGDGGAVLAASTPRRVR